TRSWPVCRNAVSRRRHRTVRTTSWLASRRLARMMTWRSPGDSSRRWRSPPSRRPASTTSDRSAAATLGSAFPRSSTPSSSALPDFPGVGPALRGPIPGLNLNSTFWRARLAELNREQVVLAQLQWRLVHGAMDAMKRYVETVVLPAVRRAEQGGGLPALA